LELSFCWYISGYFFMNRFQVGDRVRVVSETGASTGGYTFTKVGSEGIIQRIEEPGAPFSNSRECRAVILFDKLTGRDNTGNKIWGVTFSDLESCQYDEDAKIREKVAKLPRRIIR